MNAHTERDKCRYCQIDLVDIQKLTPPTSSVMKCPVCGYSELGKPSLVENHTNYSYSKISIIGHQAPTA